MQTSLYHLGSRQCVLLLFWLLKAQIWNLLRHRRSAGARYRGAGGRRQSVQETRQRKQRSSGAGRVRHQRAQQEHRQGHAACRLARSQGSPPLYS